MRVAHQRVSARMAVRADGRRVVAIVVVLGPFVGAFELGPEHPEVVAGDQVAIDAHLMLDLEKVDAVADEIPTRPRESFAHIGPTSIPK